MAYPFKLSIITVNLNNKEGLQKTIDSVINQTCQDFEWIIIDGGSTDGSKELIERYNNQINFWISERDDNMYQAMNKGINYSKGKFMLFLNSGDFLYEKDTIKNVISELENSDFYIGDEIQKNKVYSIKLNEESYTKDIIRIVTKSYFPHQSTFINRSVFKEYGLYREDYNLVSDTYLFYKALLLGNAQIKRIPRIISYFEGGGKSEILNKECLRERNNYMSETPRIKFLTDFYFSYNEMINIILESKFLYSIYRIYYFFYKKFKYGK